MKKRKFSKKEISEFSVDKKPKSYKKSIILALIGIGIISIMVGSALNLWGGETGTIKYKDYKFVKEDNIEGGWNSYINGNTYSFSYLPQEIENLTNLNINFNSNQIYVLFDPKDSDILSSVYEFKKLFNEFNKVAFPACIEDQNCGDFPVYDCNKINEGVYLISSERNIIYKKDNCFIIDGDYEYYLKSINYLRYKMLGVF